MKKSILLILSCILFLTYCSKEDDNSEKVLIDPSASLIIADSLNYFSYQNINISGNTDLYLNKDLFPSDIFLGYILSFSDFTNLNLQIFIRERFKISDLKNSTDKIYSENAVSLAGSNNNLYNLTNSEFESIFSLGNKQNIHGGNILSDSDGGMITIQKNSKYYSSLDFKDDEYIIIDEFKKLSKEELKKIDSGLSDDFQPDNFASDDNLYIVKVRFSARLVTSEINSDTLEVKEGKATCIVVN